MTLKGIEYFPKMYLVYDALKVLQTDVSKFVVTRELIGHCRYESIVFVNGI